MIACGLLARRQDAHLAVNALAPGPAAGSGRAPVVEAHHHITALGEHAVPEIEIASPAVDHVLGGRLTVDVNEHGILLGGIEAGRFEAPAVKHHAIADVNAEELAPIARERIELRPQLGVAHERLCHLVVGQAHQLGDRRPAQRRIRVKRPAHIR